MRDFRDAKVMAQTLRQVLKARSVSLTHSESLELMAKTFGFPDWNFLAAKIQASQPVTSQPVTGQPAPATAPPSISAGSIVPIVPMRDIVLFPQMVVPIFVGRDKTRRAIERALTTNRRILVVTQRRAADDDPALDGLYAVGVTAGVVNCVTLPDGNLKLVVSGLERTRVVRSVGEEYEKDLLAAEAAPIEESSGQAAEAVILSRAVLDSYRVYANVDYSALPQGLQARLRLPSIEDPGALADSIAPLLSIGIDQRQQLLETTDVITRLDMILELMKAGQQAA